MTQKQDKTATDEKFMRLALSEAMKAEAMGEVPVGAVIVKNGIVVASGCNMREKGNDATAHAEIEVIRKAGKRLGRWNLSDCELYVTLEPCVMCSGAIVYSRLKRVVFGASDLRFGCAGSIYNLVSDEKFNHRAQVQGGVLEDECLQPLRKFFKDRRK